MQLLEFKIKTEIQIFLCQIKFKYDNFCELYIYYIDIVDDRNYIIKY